MRSRLDISCRLFLALLLLLPLWSAAVPDRESPCDPDLTDLIGPTDDPLAYQLRKDGQCEGRYRKPVSSTNLSLVALTRALAIQGFANHEHVKVDWVAPPGTERVHLRAEGLGETFYRMDALIPGPRSTFQWSSNVVRGLKQPASEVGMLAWVEETLGASERRVYLPLSVHKRLEPRSGEADVVYLATVVLGVRVREVYVSLASAGEDGLPGSYLSEDVPLDRGYYAIGVPTGFPIEGLAGEGIYYLGISAVAQNGSTAAANLLFYHPGY